MKIILIINDDTFRIIYMEKINVIDLFAGVGGLSYGFAHNENFEIIMANEYDPDIAKAYSLNHPSVEMVNCDIKDLTAEIIKKHTGGKKIDLLVGGPPCQSYSTLGKRQMDDRANLFKEYCRVLTIVQPKAFIFENVTGLLSMQGGKLFPLIQEEFKKLGYNLKHQVLNAANFGVPQFRERVILVGTKEENTFIYPEPTHGDLLLGKPFVTVCDALSSLPILKSGESSKAYLSGPQNEFQRFVQDTEIIEENDAPNNGAHLIRIMEALPDGGDKNDLPEDIRPKSGYGNTYAKLWWDRPSTTITRNFACPSSSRCIHPRDSRAMSIREGARLQGFPDDYIFYGSDRMKRLEIGNAVPPLLSFAIAKQMLAAIRNANI